MDEPVGSRSIRAMKPSKEISVAIVDDDESLCRSLSRLLRASGIRPTAYASAEAFLEATHRPLFDCLVLDVQLGGISGTEMYRQLAAAGNRTPVVFITAHDDPEERERALANGCAGYLRKTDSGADVIEAIRRAAGATLPTKALLTSTPSDASPGHS